jgi:hypothetical protein
MTYEGFSRDKDGNVVLKYVGRDPVPQNPSGPAGPREALVTLMCGNVDLKPAIFQMPRTPSMFVPISFFLFPSFTPSFFLSIFPFSSLTSLQVLMEPMSITSQCTQVPCAHVPTPPRAPLALKGMPLVPGFQEMLGKSVQHVPKLCKSSKFLP